MEKLQTEAPHQGNTLEPRAGGPGELVLAAGAQLQALRTSMLSKGTEHRACAEGNLKIHKSAFLASSCKLSVNVLKATSPRSQEAETSVVLHSDHHLVVSPRGCMLAYGRAATSPEPHSQLFQDSPLLTRGLAATMGGRATHAYQHTHSS